MQYTGRIDRRALAAWCDSPDGRAVLEQIASPIRFALFGRLRAARRQLFRDLIAAARSAPVAATLQREIDAYLARLNALVYAHDLPRANVNLYRLIVVPRSFANTMAEQRLDRPLDRQPVFATAHGRERLREWFILTLIGSVEAAIVDARPTPNRPLQAGDGWIVIGVNDRFEWNVPFKGPTWPGHYYVLELTRDPLTRGFRKAAADAIRRLEASLPSLSREHRYQIMRQAGSSLHLLPARG